jgi:hypothetical protein
MRSASGCGSRRVSRFVPLAAALLLACPAGPGGDDGGASAFDAGTFLDACMVAPAPPEAPRLVDWPCPPGWEQVDTHAVSAAELADGYAPAVKACAPPALPASCPPGQRPTLGSSSCKVVGDACPSGDFAPAPAGAVLYVKAGATGNGSSAASPLGTIAAALTAATAGTTILIGKGSYTEYLPVVRAVTLLGACAEQTTIVAPSRSATRGTIDVGAVATVKNLTVTGPRPGVWVSNTADFARLEGVVISAAELVGLFVSDNGKAELSDVQVIDTRVDPADSSLGRGVQVRSGGQVRGSGVAVEKNRDVGVTLDGVGITFAVDDLIVRDTQSETASRAYGLGLEVRYGARATLNRVLLEKNRNSELVSDQPGSSVKLTDAVLQDTLPQENNNQYGGGLEAAPGVTIDLTRVLIRRNRATGVRIGGAAFTATDLAVTDTAPRANDNTQGLGLVMDQVGTAVITRGVFANNHIAHLLAAARGNRLTLTDVRLYGSKSQPTDGRWGMGFVLLDEAILEGTRVAIERADDSGGQVQTRAVATFNDLRVRDTGFGGPRTSGDGLAVQSSAQATVNRAWFSGNRRIGVGVHNGAVVQLADLRVTDVGPDLQGYFGRAVVAQERAIVSVTRAQIDRAREAALYSHGPQTRLYVEQAAVFDTQGSLTAELEGRALSVEFGSAAVVGCFLSQKNREVAVNVTEPGSHLTLTQARLVDTTGVEAFGDGVAVSLGATAVLDDCEISANQNLGLAFAGAQGVLKRVRVADHPIALYAGEGSTTKDVAQAGPVVPLEVQVEQSCSFERNQTRVAGDFVPVPGSVGASGAQPDY